MYGIPRRFVHFALKVTLGMRCPLKCTSCNRELRLKREIEHEDCCPLLTKLDRMTGSNGNKYVSNRRKPGDK